MACDSQCDSRSDNQEQAVDPFAEEPLKSQVALCEQVARFYTQATDIDVGMSPDNHEVAIYLTLTIPSAFGEVNGEVSCRYTPDGKWPKRITIGSDQYSRARDIANLLQFKTLDEMHVGHDHSH